MRDRRLILNTSGPVVAAVAISAAGLGIAVLLSPHAAWARGFAAASIASVIAALVSLRMVQRGLKLGPQHAAAVCMAAMVARAALSLGGCLIAILKFNAAPAPTLMAMLVYYLAVLAAETFVIFQSMRTTC